MTLRRALIGLVAGFCLLMAVLLIYAVRLRASAQALIESASEIHSTADAQRQVATWRNRSGRKFGEEESVQRGDHSYDIRVENSLLHLLRVAPPAMVGMTVTTHDGQLRSVILAMITGREPNATSGVWVQEWFDSGTSKDFRVNQKDRPWRAMVEFSSTVPEVARQRAFAFNAECLVKPTGCRTAEDILPAVWRLATPHR
jgi:hypothetical protein